MLDSKMYSGATIHRGDEVVVRDAIVSIHLAGRSNRPGGPSAWGVQIYPCPGLELGAGDVVAFTIPGKTRCEAEVSEVLKPDDVVVCLGVGAPPSATPSEP